MPDEARDNFEELAMYLHTKMLPIVVPMPAHFYCEKPPEMGNIPEHGADYGIYLNRAGANYKVLHATIANARFFLDGVEHQVTRNHGEHHLHGGTKEEAE